MIIYACIILHNFLISADPNEDLLREVDIDLCHQCEPNENHHAPHRNDNETARGERLRDSIATQM